MVTDNLQSIYFFLCHILIGYSSSYVVMHGLLLRAVSPVHNQDKLIHVAIQLQ